MEEGEIRAMLHDILLKMPVLKGAFGNGDITVEDTKPYVDDMLNSILEEFDEDGDKTISKTEITDISAAITTLVYHNIRFWILFLCFEKKGLDLKKLRDAVENRAVDELWKKYAGEDMMLDREELHELFSDMVNQFNHSQAEPLPKEATDPYVQKMVDAAFREYDDDESGEISRDEFKDAPRFLARLVTYFVHIFDW